MFNNINKEPSVVPIFYSSSFIPFPKRNVSIFQNKTKCQDGNMNNNFVSCCYQKDHNDINQNKDNLNENVNKCLITNNQNEFVYKVKIDLENSDEDIDNDINYNKINGKSYLGELSNKTNQNIFPTRKEDVPLRLCNRLFQTDFIKKSKHTTPQKSPKTLYNNNKRDTNSNVNTNQSSNSFIINKPQNLSPHIKDNIKVNNFNLEQHNNNFQNLKENMITNINNQYSPLYKKYYSTLIQNNKQNNNHIVNDINISIDGNDISISQETPQLSNDDNSIIEQSLRNEENIYNHIESFPLESKSTFHTFNHSNNATIKTNKNKNNYNNNNYNKVVSFYSQSQPQLHSIQKQKDVLHRNSSLSQQSIPINLHNLSELKEDNNIKDVNNDNEESEEEFQEEENEDEEDDDDNNEENDKIKGFDVYEPKEKIKEEDEENDESIKNIHTLNANNPKEKIEIKLLHDNTINSKSTNITANNYNINPLNIPSTPLIINKSPPQEHFSNINNTHIKSHSHNSSNSNSISKFNTNPSSSQQPPITPLYQTESTSFSISPQAFSSPPSKPPFQITSLNIQLPHNTTNNSFLNFPNRTYYNPLNTEIVDSFITYHKFKKKNVILSDLKQQKETELKLLKEKTALISKQKEENLKRKKEQTQLLTQQYNITPLSKTNTQLNIEKRIKQLITNDYKQNNNNNIFHNNNNNIKRQKSYVSIFQNEDTLEIKPFMKKHSLLEKLNQITTEENDKGSKMSELKEKFRSNSFINIKHIDIKTRFQYEYNNIINKTQYNNNTKFIGNIIMPVNSLENISNS